MDNVSCTDVGTYGLYDTNTVRLTGTGLNFTSRLPGVRDSNRSTCPRHATGLVNLTNVIRE